MVVGGGNSALEESSFLTNFAKKVTVIHRRDAFRGDKLLQKKLLDNPKVNVVWDSVIEDVIGTENPKGVTAS